MKTKKYSIALVIIMTIFYQQIFAQETWETQTFITGYVAVEGEVITGDVVDRMKSTKGIGLSEAGLVYTVQPLKQLEFKAGFVHKPGFNLDQSFVEIYGQWKFQDAFAIKGGRILTPVSPVNLYFYAPMNYGIAVPMLVSHHAFYPQSIEGVEVNGKVDLGNCNLKYDLITGGYYDIGHMPVGALKFHGAECAYIWDYEEGVDIQHHLMEESFHPSHLNLCSGARVAMNPVEFLTVGVSAFIGELHTEAEINDSTVIEVEAKKQYVGLTLEAEFNNLEVMGEYWTGKVDMDDKYDDIDGVGYYIEADYTIADKFTPFVKYEYHEDVHGEYYKRPTVGACYRPIFNMILKAEYHMYSAPKAKDGKGMDFNSFMIQLIYTL